MTSKNNSFQALSNLIRQKSTNASDLEKLQRLINQVKTENRINGIITFDTSINSWARSFEEGTLLILAASIGNTNAAYLLLKVGANISQKANKGLNALHVTAANGYIDIVAALLAAGVDVNAKDQVRIYFAIARCIYLECVYG